MEQQLLFPELDPYKTKIKNIDYIDVSKIKCGELKKTSYSVLPEGMYMLFKSGGFNKYHPEMGNAFPYIQNTKTLKVLSTTATEYIGYVKASILLPNKQALFIQMHRIVAEAFIENDMPEKKILVDHINGDALDYRYNNLRWVTHSQNNTGVKRKRQITFFDKARIENLKNKK
tara:strand:- start:444 stop:962 length:519 start_codon:yes stop_codon:yes gene_type:complete